ncbi:helix-turn-helix domain-containing protein [Micromonospora narathiwatensis]|uniref:helix-turn-helix domain-containing protein n=1 Tax=Micromonospora narathiwatensis TaxID=299146 RepID=UPI0014305DE7
MARAVKRAFKYRFYPTGTQSAELSRTRVCLEGLKPGLGRAYRGMDSATGTDHL